MDLRGDLLTDIRVLREAKWLVNNGYQVTVLCNSNSRKRHLEINNGINIHGLTKQSPIAELTDELVRHLSLVSIHRYQELAKLVRRLNVDILHTHDLPTARYGTLLSKRYDLPLVLDLHELYPESVGMWRENLSFKDRIRPNVLFSPSWRWRMIERSYLPRASAIITVSEEAKYHFERQYTIDSTSIHVVRNVPDLEKLNSFDTELINLSDGFNICYVGNFSPQRGLEDCIHSVSELQSQIPDLTLYLVGDSGVPGYVSDLKSLANDLGVIDSVVFTGWVDFSKVPSYIYQSDVALLPLIETADSEYALPNKLFQYMYFGTPVIASDFSAMRKVISENQSGILVPPEDLESISKSVQFLFENKGRAREMGRNGIKAVKARYNFAKEGQHLEDAYRVALNNFRE